MPFDFNPDDYPAPHCNPEVLHAPGVCFYCDKYPGRQRLRSAAGTAFSPTDLPWPGNRPEGYADGGLLGVVAPPNDGDEKPCTLPPFGWYCSLGRGHDGPCPTRPEKWNVKSWIRRMKGRPG